MANNTLVVCGGTGAHVALAFVRLHTLGQPLGFFRDADDKPLAFPTVYLVDQDSGDGDGEATAWQLTRRLVDSHPGRHDWRAAIGRPDAPELKLVTPLPVGPDRAWFYPPHDRLGQRLADSPYLDLLTSRAQQDIRFSHGMMGSPAVGSLLFRLKAFDTKPGGLDTNHDGAYHELLSTRGRVAVVGSAVGGTGASVAPTLAQRFADDGDDVMAVMVLNWFRFDQEGLDEATLEKAQRRNRSMAENADSAFAYYGRRLARRVATVPVGAPDSALRTRRYTSDTRQPIRESFLHAVAALGCLQQFLDREPRAPGLYQMGAEDPTRLGGGNRLPGAGGDSVQSLANQAATLADVLEVFARALSATRGGGPFRVVPAICKATASLAAPNQVASELGRLVADYRDHLAWMKEVLGVAPELDTSLTREALSRERLSEHPIGLGAGSGAADQDAAALALLHWTASWIRDHARGAGGALIVRPARTADGGYWPPLAGHDGLNVAAERPGELTQVPDPNVQGTVQGFVHAENLAQNGWPDPMAAPRYFRYAIEHEHATERRQLEMLLAGVVTGRLTLRDVAPRENPPLLSLDHLVNEDRKERLPELARVEIVHEHHDGDVALGFNSPLTLFCPTPIENDERREWAWGRLWQALTGSERPRDWRTEEMREWRLAGPEVQQIRTWIEREKRLRGGTAPAWAHVFADQPRSAPAPFGRGRALTVIWGTGADAAPVTLALPAKGDWWPDEETPRIPEAEIPAALASALTSATTEAGVTFARVDFRPPAPHHGSGERREPTRAFWREHLDHLQIRGDIAALGVRPDERRLALLTADHRSAAIIENVVVLDRDEIMVRDCTPMRQDPVPGSATRPGRVRYPDYPLKAHYLDLVETEDGRRVVDLLRNGKAVRPPAPHLDSGPRRPGSGGGPPAIGEPTPRPRPGGAATPRERAPASASSWLQTGFEKAGGAVGSLVSAGRRAVEDIAGVARDSEAGASTGPRAPDDPRSGEFARGAPRGGATRRPSAKATWDLRLAGRSDRVSIVLDVPPEDDAGEDDTHHRAHWMVWPRFRSTEAPHWRAYYVYEHCTNPNLHPATLWLDPDDGCVRRCEPPARGGAHPVRFTGGDRRAHTGGPPLAFSLENRTAGREQGLYVINLDALPRRGDEVKVGIDFGTSHTVAAVQADGGKHLVELAPELPMRKNALALHASENWSHVIDDDLGLKKLGVWLPTYTDDPIPTERQGLLPSELLTIEPLAGLGGDDLSQWQPGRDCVIPFMDMQRQDLAAHLLSDFKWRASEPAFRGREHILREIYLGMALELVMADVAGRRLGALPAQVDLTFTYPLRDSIEQVRRFEGTLGRVLDSGGRALGTEFRLADDIGIYNESSAAKGGTRVFGEVCLVGDLGGGTLDLFISAEGGPGIDFEEVADSAKLGGNELLRTMSDHPDRFLPPGWASRSEDAQTQLRAWMRSKGSSRFLGSAGTPERHVGLGVTGFAKPAESRAASALITRYFRLIAEYMARSLVAYLVRHWYARVLEQRPDDRKKLRVLVQLRGNGWRLWPDHSDYAEIERQVAARVAERTAELWRDRAGDRDAWREQDALWRKHGLWKETAEGDPGRPTVDAPACAPEGSRAVNPKAAPILRVVGRGQRHEDIRACSHALVELEVLTDRTAAEDGAGRKIRWFDRLPVEIGASDARVEFHRIEPPFSLSHPSDRMRRVIEDLEPELKRDINEALHEHGIWSEVHFKAPIAAIVWEQAFKARRFVEGQ